MKLLKDTFRQRIGFKLSYVLILIILVLPMTASAFDITGPMSITEPGTYILQNDILDQASGIQIYSSGVIIDGNGHTIDGLGSSGTGILIGGTGYPTYSNIEIRDLMLSDWLLGISVPMTGGGASDIRLRNVQFAMAGSGTRGIYGYRVTDAVIDSCTFTGTPFAAIEFPVGAVRPTVRDSHFTGGQNALLINGLPAAPGGAVFSGNTIEGATIGLYANYFAGAEITGNTVRSNQEGIRIGTMTSSTITGNTVTSNTVNGLSLYYCTGNTIANNYFSNTLNIDHYQTGTWTPSNTWALPLHAGTNIIDGPTLGGNYWGKPDGTGFSNTAADLDNNGIADTPYMEQYVNDPLPLVPVGQNPNAPNPVPEFPSMFLPVAMITGFLGAVLLIQRTRGD